jgi:chemotaxis methyl-accepting protein methylase
MELASRGIDVVGVDLDDDLLNFARRSQPSIEWVHADLATMQLGRRFTIVAMPGNVMIFCRPSDRSAIVGSAAAHLEPGGLLVAGFELETRHDALTLAEYDEQCTSHHFELVERWATWDREPYRGGTYAVSVHRLLGG